MTYDMNDAELPRGSDLIPDGSFVKVIMHLRKGGLDGQGEADRGLLKATKTQGSDVKMLDCEFTVTAGPHIRRKFWQTFTVVGGKVDEQGVSIGWKISKGVFRAMIDSALGLDSQDMSEAAKAKRMLRGLADLHGITFAAIRNAEKLYTGLNVIRQTLSDWSSEADIGITVRNVDASQIELRRVEGFTIGMRTLGDGRGVEDSTFTLGRIVNNRIGLDIWCATATAWNTSIRYYGGHFAQATGVNASQDRFGVRFGNEAGAYSNHNRHVFDAPNFELRQAGSNIAIPFLNQTSGSAIIVRNMRMEACSPLAARHTAGAQDCEYDIAWTNTYLVGIDYTATANRCGNAVINRHRAPASRFQRFLAGVPNTRAAAFRQSATEVGVEGLITIATSTTTAAFMADFCFNGLTDVTPTDRAVTLAANRGLGWMLDTSQAKEFALAHWLTSGASGGRLFVRVFDGAGNVREDIAGDVLASITTMQWNGPAKGWNAGAPMDDANFNRRQTIRVGASVAYAQVGVIGFDGPIDLQSLRLYGLPEAAPAVLNGTPLLPQSGQREFAAEVSWDLPSLAPGATSLIDVTVSGTRAGDLASASLVSSTRFIEIDAAVWSNNTVRVMARNISAVTFDLAAATLSVGVAKRRVP